MLDDNFRLDVSDEWKTTKNPSCEVYDCDIYCKNINHTDYGVCHSGYCECIKRPYDYEYEVLLQDDKMHSNVASTTQMTFFNFMFIIVLKYLIFS